MAHLPALLKESVSGLRIRRDSLVIDATADGGGHAAEFLKKLGRRGKLILLDWDPEMISILRKKFGSEGRVRIFHLNFQDIRKLGKSQSAGWRRPDAIFFDLGLSSLQLDASGRGFSFQRDEPLIMRFDPLSGPTAAEYLARANKDELAEVIWKYGEERAARKIAEAIVRLRQKREIRTTADLRRIIEGVLPRRGKIHPATRTFQALRIYLNGELRNLEQGLENGFEILKPGGRMAAISFHSLEDRIIKNFFKDKARAGAARLVTKKPLPPSAREIFENPRARSAKLRILEKNDKKDDKNNR
ncbi:MAG: 16S rRNA (cytosine(1402)-N(4))-methyltransferase RsmH [bacterium]|nr:16S rRNA (cytosine(1402)-N(4))-methyltransferase RsmH [bacterium]